MALYTRGRGGTTDDQGLFGGLVALSDAGSQCIASHYTERLTDTGAITQKFTKGDWNNDGLAESVIGSVRNARVKQYDPFRMVDYLEPWTLSWVLWFNHHRLH